MGIRNITASAFLLLLVTIARAGDGTVVVARGKWRPLTKPPSSQFEGIAGFAPVGETVMLAGRSFAATVEEKGVRVQIREGDSSRKLVKVSSTAVFQWKEGSRRISVELRLARLPDGRFAFHAAQALEVEIAGESIALIDADCDGVLAEPGVDGYLHGGGTAMIPFREYTVIGSQPVRFSPMKPGATAVEMTLRPAYGNGAQKEALARINRFRGEHGIDAVELSPELCSDTEEYIAYVLANNGDRSKPISPSKQGYTAGAERGSQRVAACGGSLNDAVDLTRLVYRMRSSLVTPGLGIVGASLGNASWVGLDLRESRLEGWVPPVGWKEFILCPADGSTDYPVKYSDHTGDRDPVPGAAGRGPPLTVMYPHRSDKVREFTCKLFELSDGSPVSIPVLIAEDDPACYVCGALPEARLKNRTTYRVEYTWIRDGVAEAAHAEFTTE